MNIEPRFGCASDSYCGVSEIMQMCSRIDVRDVVQRVQSPPDLNVVKGGTPLPVGFAVPTSPHIFGAPSDRVNEWA